jgi:HD superfamily phosphohydrolase YqeK
MRAVAEVLAMARKMATPNGQRTENEQFDAGYRYAAGVLHDELKRTVEEEFRVARAACDLAAEALQRNSSVHG